MSEETTQPGVRIDESLWQEFREDIKQRKGGIRGHLRSELENAITEYLNASDGGDTHDRLRRLENQVELIVENTDSIAAEIENKNKDSGVGSRTKKRLSKIQDRVEREAGDAQKIHESVINKAIEDIAGSSEVTLRRYKDMLEQRHIAFPWPLNDGRTWWLDKAKFVQLIDNEHPNTAFELRQEYGTDWWEEQLEEETDLAYQ